MDFSKSGPVVGICITRYLINLLSSFINNKNDFSIWENLYCLAHSLLYMRNVFPFLAQTSIDASNSRLDIFQRNFIT